MGGYDDSLLIHFKLGNSLYQKYGKCLGAALFLELDHCTQEAQQKYSAKGLWFRKCSYKPAGYIKVVLNVFVILFMF